MKRTYLLQPFGHHDGSAVIFVAVAMLLLLAFAALAVDVGHLYVVRTELQNAADAGALAGAQKLYINNGANVNPLANQEALDFVEKNYSENEEVQVQSIERGHWRFSDRTFEVNETQMLPPMLGGVSSADLDANPQFVNAVRVITTRKRDMNNELPADFFGRILGDERAEVKAVAVAYIGFAGQIEPGGVDFPIAICARAITESNGSYTCGVGRMINSGGGNSSSETGGWTNYAQPCETASASSVKPIVLNSNACTNAGNTAPILFGGEGVGTTGGMVDTVLDKMVNCWTGWTQNKPYDPSELPPPTQPWPMKFPVVDCTKNNVGNCVPVVGAVELNVLWIVYKNDPNYLEVPRTMYHPTPTVAEPLSGHQWTCTNTATGEVAGRACWDEFTDEFDLQWDVNSTSPASYQEKTIYILPDCKPHELTGLTGGQNFGVLAKIPVLVW